MKNISDYVKEIVRPYTALLFSTAAVAFVALGIIDGDFFKTLVSLVIGYYFGQRSAEKVEQALNTEVPKNV